MPNPLWQQLATTPRIQPKLTLGAPNDPFEKEADRVADQVMRMPEPGEVVQRTCSACAKEKEEEHVQRKCAECEKEEKSAGTIQRCSCAEEDEVQRQGDGQDTTPSLDPQVASGIETLRGSRGTPLSGDLRGFYEPRLGRDLSQVRLHTGANAGGLARSIQARAFTVGNDIAFAPGQFSPSTHSGRQLLAHELTHVIQQQPGTARRSPENTVQREDEKGDKEKESKPEPDCSAAPRGLGFKKPAPDCPTKPDRDIGLLGKHFHFCLDSDVLVAESAATVAAFVKQQPADARFLVHGYSSRDGAADYNFRLACHRANRMAGLLADAGVTPGRVQTASKGPTDEFPGGPEFNRVAVVLAEVPPGRRFGQTESDPACPKAPTGLGDVRPDPPCPDDPTDMGALCQSLPDPQRSRECDSYHFCLDSDVFATPETPRSVMKFARRQLATAHFTVHGYASDEGAKDYNSRLSCHRAMRVARELMNAGVQPEKIAIAGKGATTQFPGGPEFNRVAVVHATPPVVGEKPELAQPKTQEEKHELIRLAVERINQGAYRLEADAYISFWTCEHVPTVRHAVNTTTILAEGDPGTPVIKPHSGGGITAGRSTDLGLNTVVVSNQIFRSHDPFGCVVHAIVLLSFQHKVRDQDFGTDHGRGSEREEAGQHLVHLADVACDDSAGGEDPRKDKPAPDCLREPPPTRHGPPTAADKAARVPRFQVDESAFLTSSGPTVATSDTAKNRVTVSTRTPPFTAHAKVSLHDHPQEFRNYDVGYMVTIVEDVTTANYGGGTVTKVPPTPIRDTDGQRPAEPWFADSAVKSAGLGRVSVDMAKQIRYELPLRHEDIGGDTSQPPGKALTSAQRSARFQVWLVARRRGAPLDRFSTRFLSGSAIEFDQNLQMTGTAGTGRFTTKAPVTGADQNVMRFRGPTPEELEAKDTTKTDILPHCAEEFGKVKFELTTQQAKGAKGVGNLFRRTAVGVTAVRLETTAPIDYRPTITLIIRDPTADPGKFEVGLVQNILENTAEAHYTTGEVVRETFAKPLPLKDGDPGDFDEMFMSTHAGELEPFTRQRRQARLKQPDQPGTGAFLDLATHIGCPNKKQGTLTDFFARSKFRAWVVVRFNGDNSCRLPLHHVDWEADLAATVNPDRKVREDLVVTEPDGDGSPRFVIGRPVASEVLGDDACVPKKP
ncbi:MAG TPA: DUF4157 domain-containing protein [Thermoanaerobaculia bacterium]|nr:DUF4157 domain-containing protein [Thermoanaerobaculia bacterium]